MKLTSIFCLCGLLLGLYLFNIKADLKSLSQIGLAKIEQSVPPPNPTKESIVQHSAVELKRNNFHEEFVPWEDLKLEWHEILKNHLILISEESGEEIFNKFIDEKKDFERTLISLNQKEKFLGTSDEISDKNLLAETTAKINLLHNKYIIKVKQIFGEYYPSVSKLHYSFESGAQAFSKTQQRIIVDPAFVE